MNISGIVTLCVLKFGRFDICYSLYKKIKKLTNILFRLTDGVITLPELIHPQPTTAQNISDEWFSIENLSDKSLKLALEVEVFPQLQDLITLEVCLSLLVDGNTVHEIYSFQKGFAQNIKYANSIIFTSPS